ncbi:hypothetical protein F5Y10DRAFT_278439 [Nemania abortiva]|nr:hypothetical protein F5Y10DRAFT_278439 [Nemania abortiva]
MAKADSKVQARSSLLKTSKSPRRKPGDASSKIHTEHTRRAGSSKKTSPDNEDPIPSAPIHAKRSLETTLDTSRPPGKRARLAGIGRLQARVEDEEKVQGDIRQPFLELHSTSAVRRLDAPQLALKSDSPNKETQTKRVQLTRENLIQFDKMAGADISKETGPTSLSTEKKTTSTKTSTSWPSFARKARKNGILHPIESEPPANLEVLRERYAQSRRSPSPTPSEFECYRETVSMAMNESTIQWEIGSELLKKHRSSGFIRALDQQCTAFPKNVGFNNGLRTLKPDFIEGLVVHQFDPFPVDEHIEGAVFQNKEFPITLPHLAGEWKASGRNLDNARIQTAYDGASLVYARNQALAYLGETELSSDAAITTFVTDGSTLKLYAHYASQGTDDTVEYHQCLVNSIHMESYTGFKDGRKELRNAQEYAKEQSCLLRDRLKEQWGKNNSSLELAQQPHDDSSVTRQTPEQKVLPLKRVPRISKRSGVKFPKRKNARLLSKPKS